MIKHNEYLNPSLKLDDTYEVKILLAYFMWQLGRPITRNQLTEIATADGGVNYFLYSDAVEQMLSSNMIITQNIDGEEYYTLSESAKRGANDFKRFVPKSFRDRILSRGLKFFAKLKNDKSVNVEIVKMEKGYSVNCLCTESGISLMDLKLFAPDEEQAKMLADKISLNPADFYSKIIDFAIENEEYDPEPEEVSDL